MGEIFSMQAGKAISASSVSPKANGSHCIPCYGGNGIRGYVEHANQNNTAVLIGRQGALCGNVRYATGTYYATEHAVVVTCSDNVDMRFAYHVLLASDLNQYKTAGAQPGLSVRKLSTIPVPIPPLAEQQRIVDILDKFDALTNDISASLPAEIEARRKQYAYYRDKLLTFKEKVA